MWSWMWAIWTRPGALYADAVKSDQEPPVAEIVTLAVVLPSALQFMAVQYALGWWAGAASVLKDVVVAGLSIAVQVPLLVWVGSRLGWSTTLSRAFRPYGMAWAVNVPGVLLLIIFGGVGGRTVALLTLGLIYAWYWWLLAQGVRAYSGMDSARSWLAVAPVVATDVLLFFAVEAVDGWLFSTLGA